MCGGLQRLDFLDAERLLAAALLVRRAAFAAAGVELGFEGEFGVGGHQ